MPTDNRNTAGRWGPSPWHDTATPPTDTQADSRPLSADAWPWSRPATRTSSPAGFPPYQPNYPSSYGPYSPYAPADVWSPEPATPGQKPVAKSKTVWSGFAVFLMSLLSYFQGQQFIQSEPSLVAICGMGIGAIMIGLRFLTNTPVTPPTVVVQQQPPPAQAFRRR